MELNAINSFVIILLFIPLIPYFYGVEVRLLVFYTIGRTPWTSDRPVARPLSKHKTTQTQNKRTHTHTHTHTYTYTYTPNIHDLSGIRTHDHGLQASEDSSCLRPLGYRNRLVIINKH
jgi:hypothetical protein